MPVYSLLDADAFLHDDYVESALFDFASSPLDEDDCSLSAETVATCSSTSSEGDSDSNSISSSDSILNSDDFRNSKSEFRAAHVPPLTDVTAPVDPVNNVPAVIQALYQSHTDLRELDVCVVEYYADLRAISPLLSPAVAPRAHVDGGSIASITDDKSYLFCYRPFTPTELRNVARLRVADGTIHLPTGVGYLKVPCRNGHDFVFVRSFYVPQIPATILSPDSIAKTMGCAGYSTYSDLRDGTASMQLIDCSSCNKTVSFGLESIRGLLFTDSLIAPTPSEHESDTLPVTDSTMVAPDVVPPSLPRHESAVRALTAEQQRALWHCRLGHTNARNIADLHKYADGIPKMTRSDAITSCPLCLKSKLHKANRGPPEDSEPEVCWQDIQIDMGFMVVDSNSKSKKNTRAASINALRVARRGIAALRNMDTAPRRSSRSTRFTGSYSSSSRPPSTGPSSRPLQDDPVPDDFSESPLPFYPPPLPEKYSFERIMTHEGPIFANHKRYKGARFNLKIKWSNGQTTWEPFTNVFEDQPHEVAEYARTNNLLGNRDWSAVRDFALDPANEPLETAFHEEFDNVLDTTVPTSDDLADKPLRYKRALGLYGETCYVIITDRKSGSIKVSTRRNKEPPTDFLTHFIANYKPSVSNCRVRFDGGGELGGNTTIHELFEKAGYEVEVTPPDTSSAIGLAERPHRTIADGVRTMLHSANLPLKYWPFALHYFVLIHNCLPHGDRDESAYTICTGKRFNMSRFRIFGCRAFALPTMKRDLKLDVHARSGIFLGFRKSLGVALYLDLATNKVKSSRHVAFDEGMSDMSDPPPFVKFLNDPSSHLDWLDLTKEPTLDVSLSPFSQVSDVTCAFRPQDEFSLGVRFDTCPRFRRAFAVDFTRPFGPHAITTARRKFLGGYITRIGDHPVFTKDDIHRVLHEYAQMATPPATLVVRVSRDLRSELADTRPPSLHLRPVDIRRVAALNLVAGEGHKFSAQSSHLFRVLARTSIVGEGLFISPC